ncbi:hypothetical protein [Flavobacterium eburneipallidum]|uniref:hypothetical protein n=1 Tax=Flavobacterium eburneipallidum TaxID=3003263 RepID=UPI002482FEFD|nr:hypothetical protein [Flavobacterium eburneipallidum]
MTLQKLKNIISQYFRIWWIPILSYLIPFGIFLIGNAFKSDDIIDFSLLMFFLNILGNIISSIIQIVIRKWYFSIPQIGISIFLFYCVSIYFTFSPPDYYGANKIIPENIEIAVPINNKPTKKELDKYDFILSSSFQPGIYNYYTAKKPKELGNFYIKAFEINSNDKLSEERIKISSKIKVENIESKIYSGEFTIYEGSWGDKYAARIELWFEPSNKNKDYKIAERNFIIEGWMR